MTRVLSYKHEYTISRVRGILAAVVLYECTCGLRGVLFVNFYPGSSQHIGCHFTMEARNAGIHMQYGSFVEGLFVQNIHVFFRAFFQILHFFSTY